MTKAGNQKSAPGRRRDPAIDTAILEAALHLFLQRGADGMNFAQISIVTGISRATIYRRWKSRGELLKATLESARTSLVRNPAALSRMPSDEFLRFLEDTIVLGLMNPVVPKLITQLIGTSSTHPELLTTWCRRTLEPGWNALFEAVAKARAEGILPNAIDPELLRDVLAGAIVHRLVSRTTQPNEKVELQWVKQLLRALGLADEPK